MKITIVMGFFLPVPPAAGGATEKSWHRLALEFARAGHAVTVVSRRWPGWPDDETRDGVRYLRLPGAAHTPTLTRNLWRDLRWSLRVWRALPPADVTIAHCVALPALLGGWPFRRPHTGRLVVMTGRMPKGQYRLYRRLDRVLAVSPPVRDAVLAENPRLAPVIKISGYPIAWAALAAPRAALSHVEGPALCTAARPAPPAAPLTIGYIGRLHREKGLHLLVAALADLARRPGLPPWRTVLRGPSEVAQGGSGPAYVAELKTAAAALPSCALEILPPEFDDARLADAYRALDIFCYPSLATQGETFGVAVAEAMAAGATPVVSALPCFGELVRPGENGEVFDHTAPDATALLADRLAALLADPARRAALAAAARETARAYDYPAYAARLLADFSTLK